MRSNRRIRDNLRGQSCLVLIFLAAWLSATMPAALLCGQEAASEPALSEEPKALLSPVNLLPVDPVAEAGGKKPSAPVAAPPVKLAPEITALGDLGARSGGAPMEGIKPANFQDITPGETTRDEVVKKLGEPAEVTEQDSTEVLSYVIDPFPTVKVQIQDNVVSSIAIHLAAPTARADVTKELGLENFRPAIVNDGQNRPLGEVYPERGLMFAYAEGATNSREARIEHVILETITVEPFLLRAQQQPAEQYSECLADLKTAQRLAPENSQPWALAAQLDLVCGKPLSALEAAQKAIALDGDSVEYQIILADARRQLGQSRDALESLRELLKRTDLSALDHARARFCTAACWRPRLPAIIGERWKRQSPPSSWRQHRRSVRKGRIASNCGKS